jgi:hypothetical protein
MYPLLVVLAAAAASLMYEAKVPSFGCNSSVEVAKLQKVRSDQTAFQGLLYQQVLSGQCGPIDRGTVVEGTVVAADPTVLHVGANVDPPGYMVPVDDFKPKGADKAADPKGAGPAAAAPAPQGEKK